MNAPATNSFASQSFMPHGMCYLWNPQMLLLQIASDAAIAVAYFSIPILLFYFIRKRRDVPFSSAFAMFCLFIVACGFTHVMGIWTIWHPAFWLDGTLKAVTAVASLTTAGMLVSLLPKALALRTPAELERLNERLNGDLDRRLNALENSERQYLTLAEAMPQIVWTAAADGAVDYFNQRWIDYTGMTLEETQGWGWEPVLHPDDLANCLAIWTSSLEHGTPYETEYRFKRASDGAYRWHVGRALPIRDSGGAIARWIGTCTDIDDQKQSAEASGRLTEQVRLNERLERSNERLERDIAARERAEAALRASEERFRQVEEYGPIGLAIMALDGQFLRVNPALCGLTGYSRDELLATTYQAITHPADLDVDLGLVTQLLAGVIKSCTLEKRSVHKDGHEVWLLSNRSLVRGDAGEPLYFVMQTQDISERKAAEREKEIAQTFVLADAEAKSRFMAMMSHEVRTPMNGIIGMTELLSRSELNDEQLEYVKVVQDSGESLLGVLNDILDYSKIEAGKLELERLDFDAKSQLSSVVSLLGLQFRTKGVALTTEVDSNVPPLLNGDPSRLRQILLNLVGNALKFTSAGGSVRIVVSPEACSGGTEALRFTVVDTGVGIAPELQDRLFKPFSQIDGSTTRTHGGTGLGLSICKQLVELMGGRIGVDSVPNAGASFWFVLPFLNAEQSECSLVSSVRETRERPTEVRSRAERILIADDNKINALLATKQLAQFGFTVTTVANGREAVDALRRERFDLVFMDCQMPVMDGFEATKEIRTLTSEMQGRVPIVAMTANAQAEDREACRVAGMEDYLAKPVTLADLSTVLERWLPAA